ncbi:hypothetical protein SAMN04490248_1842 [Salinihabitans flavidus]|uniref:Uncharacterized protein n=1 Tax=Salinihabitans flavidus TaxID=569882 RepID=A0A1H8WMC9_9RHOB|nr:hypothetical protein [Salinihabitans flavidus]SEP28749.1 hypothetical protein SAMN04490248_1842 [Salinihabitans flavidus]
MTALARPITPAPLLPEELVPDAVLRDLAHGGPERATGEFTPEDAALLAMYLPDICGELLARRLAAR